ncbi:2OG-Fe(II) oxygenase [Parasegetibacter sp. NRK P23]|uniref:2OG-Fe(II) oxygenase n=1 Tax=Parasegetibacter sp. NRK P23 TaxID=2942999 RepID=UPI0020447D6B|nr:2OG-Fe(II) oxygenase [Parasegetibacter sp. NRK P23]MCM5527509.1 2OG-Fe(II) oxygenase [Parasegetibacter sp. NRK P23]
MINLDFLEANKERLREAYLLAKPFPYLIIDNFCDPVKMEALYAKIPELNNKSRDYVFANNKFEKSNYKELGTEFQELYDDLISDRMNAFLSFIANEEVFVDPKNHGGGLHQGKKNSFLDMHLDFNYHPLQTSWFRNMNLLLYLNKDWHPSYKGHLKIQDLRTGETKELEVPFNRMIIQQTRAYTLHGYEMTNFPDGKFRTSIATYAYTTHMHHVEKPRTTDWVVSDAKPVKKMLASIYGPAVKIKNKLFGSGTAKNQ